MTRELEPLFLVQQIRQSTCSSYRKVILHNTSLFTLYITSLNLSQNKFEDQCFCSYIKEKQWINYDVCQNHSGDISTLQHFVILSKFLCIDLHQNITGEVFFLLTLNVFGQNYVLRDIVQCLNCHFTVAIKDHPRPLWVYIDNCVVQSKITLHARICCIANPKVVFCSNI